MSATVLLGSHRAVHTRLVIPSRGIWFADVDFDLDATRIVPSGRQKLSIAGAELSGTVDETGSGRFGEKGKARIIGGAAGWQKDVPRKPYHNDAGVKSSDVIETTAAEVGESVVGASKDRLGVDWARQEGPASRVLNGLDWHVDLAGVTRIGTWPASTVPATATLKSWDPEHRRAELACTEILTPGMVLKDDRFGEATIRDVEQVFGDDGATATVWCGTSSAPRLVDGIVRLVLEQLRAGYLAAYRYRVVLEGVDKRLTLQAIEKPRGFPDLLPISMWPGMAGLSATLTPGTEVLVDFVGGDPAQPVVRSFAHGVPPLVLELAAVVSMLLTTPSLSVTGVVSAAGIAAGPMAVSPFGMLVGGVLAEPLVLYPAFATWAAAVVAACAAHTPPIAIPPFPGAGATTILKGL